MSIPNTPLVYLSHPLAGDFESNLDRAQAWLQWAHRWTSWGLWVVCPWLASARAGFAADLSELRGMELGGPQVEARTLRNYNAVLHCGPVISKGMAREAAVVSARGGRIYQLLDDDMPCPIAPPDGPLRVVDTTSEWR